MPKKVSQQKRTKAIFIGLWTDKGVKHALDTYAKSIDRKRAPIAETFIIEGLRQRGFLLGGRT